MFNKKMKGTVSNALVLDDNDYPKQLWSFTLTGRKFAKRGPVGYALAHLADHKKHNNRATEEFDIIDAGDRTDLDGLYTSSANVVYLPTSVIRPTDFSKKLRNLLIRRADKLYGVFCKLLPPWLAIRGETDPEWDENQFKWAEPVGDLLKIPEFLDFRLKTMQELFRKKSVSLERSGAG